MFQLKTNSQDGKSNFPQDYEHSSKDLRLAQDLIGKLHKLAVSQNIKDLF